MDTEEFVAMMGNKINVDRIKKAVNSYTEAVRGENDYVTSMNKGDYIGLSKFINTLYSVGAARALVSFTQSFKQTIPVIIGAVPQVGRFLFSKHTHGVGMPGSSTNRWINRSGYPIANRGGIAYFEATNEEKVARGLSLSKNAAEKILKFFDKYATYSIQYSLGAADVYAARKTFISYYLQGLNKQGLPWKGINWDTHEVNEEAASYAQLQVDRTQVTSDEKQRGTVYTSKGVYSNVFRKSVMAFASFSMNLKTRIYSDLRVMSNPNSTLEDRGIALKSFSGAMVEATSFVSLRFIINMGFANLAAAMIGFRDDEDDEGYVDVLGFAVDKKTV